MEIDTRKVDDVLVVGMAGKLDALSDLDDAVARITGDDKQVVLNLENLEYVSSAGLRIIMQGAQLLQTNGGELKICSAHSDVRRVLEVSGFTNVLKIYDTEKDAVVAFSAAQ